MPELNAGSMADIAFLLLIFFLVVTTIAEDKGIPVILPEYYEGPPGPAADRNVLKILVDADDRLLVESQLTDIDNVKNIVIDFVNNEDNSNKKPRTTDDAIISIHNDERTSYEAYVKIYSHIHSAYKTLRNDYALVTFDTEYDQLSIANKNVVLKKYPLKLSEADPFTEVNI